MKQTESPYGKQNNDSLYLNQRRHQAQRLQIMRSASHAHRRLPSAATIAIGLMLAIIAVLAVASQWGVKP